MEEKNIHIEIGARLREVRSIFNEGSRLSSEQFAYLLDETRDKIINYELGRAAVPLRVLLELYRRGINPIYLLSGDGDIFAKNIAGKTLKEKIAEKAKKNSPKHTFVKDVRRLKVVPEETEIKTLVVKAAAGKIPKSPKES
jgi:hypothetical protein